MTSISTNGQHLRMQSQNMLILQRQTDLREQVATGKKAQVFGGLGVEARSSIDLRSHVKEVENYQKNIDTAKLRITSMVEAMTRITSVTREMQSQLVKLSGNSNPDTKVINDLARHSYDEVVTMLNTKVEGRYLFSGSDIDNAPIQDANQLRADVAAQVATYPAVGADAVQAATRTIAESNAYYSTALGQPEASPIRARIDRNLDIDFTLRANGTEAPDPAPAPLPAFREILRSLATASAMSYDSSNPGSLQEFTKLVEATRDNLKNAALNVESQMGIFGNIRSRMDAVDTRHEDMLVTLKRRIGNVEDVDMADAITRLQASQTQLEASYRVTATMRDISLSNYL